eukprot:gene7884-1409_t
MHSSETLATAHADSSAVVSVENLSAGSGLCLARDGDLQALIAKAAGGWCAKTVDRHGSNAVMWAAGNGQAEVVRWLVDSQNADVNSKNKNMRTALHWYRVSTSSVTVLFLTGALTAPMPFRVHLFNGADPTARTVDGTSVFDFAVFSGQPSTCHLISSLPSTDVHSTNQHGCSAVHWACAAGHIQVCRWLLDEQKLDFGIINDSRHGAVNKAAWKGHLDLLKWLVEGNDDCAGPSLAWQLALTDFE